MIPRHFQGVCEVKTILSFCFFHSVDICSDSTEAKVDKTADILAQIKTAPPAALVDILFFICMHCQKAKQRVSLRNDVDEAAGLLILLNHDPWMYIKSRSLDVHVFTAYVMIWGVQIKSYYYIEKNKKRHFVVDF